ncbi:MAG: alanine racemase [Eubacterium sp.]
MDTGMGRYGFLPSEVEKAIKCYDFENLDFCGAYTHFSSAFHNAELTKVQLEMFKDTIEQIKKSRQKCRYSSCCQFPCLIKC